MSVRLRLRALRRRKPPARSGPAAGERGISADALRDAVRSRPLRPYERLMPGDEGRFAQAVLEHGWTLNRHPPIPMVAPLRWDEVAATSRSWHYHLHCWDGLGPLLAAHDESGDERPLRVAFEVALDWAQTYQSLDSESPFAWYDMAVGLRAYRLAYLLDAVARTDWATDDGLELLMRSALLHRASLDDERQFAGHSNHGLYQAAGHRALAARLPELPGMAAAWKLAATRLRTLIDSQFTSEGVHREHSPGYHLLLLDALIRVRASGLLAEPGGAVHAGAEPALEGTIAKAEEALAWFVQPDGRLAMIGDTGYGFSPTGEYSSPALRFVVSGGAEGKPPDEPVRAFKESGFAVLRGPWPRSSEDFSEGTYLALHCGFHSTAHKHADDLSFVWHDRGQDLLVDAGRYGYVGRTTQGSALWRDGFNYDHPARVYVESTRAHNTVEVDGLNLPRRDVTPYGSRLRSAGEHGGLLFAEATTVHRQGVEHTRIVVLAPTAWLSVVDLLQDPAAVDHRYRQWLHFAPELTVTRHGVGLTAHGGREPLRAIPLTGARPLDPVRGQEQPELLGWTSRAQNELTACCSAAFEVGPSPAAVLATVFTFSVAVPKAGEDTGIDLTRRGGRLAWSDSAGEHVVTLAHTAGGALRASYDQRP